VLKLGGMAHAYKAVHANRAGHELVHPYNSETELSPGDVLRLEGRFWLVDSVEGDRLLLRPARYRLRLRHPDGREEIGAFRRYRPDAPRLGHTFTTVEDGAPAGWVVTHEELARDESGEAYLDLVAERDFDAADPPAAHELEHAIDDRDELALPAEAADALAQAAAAGLSTELVALDAGEAPDWDAASSYIDALVLEEIEDDLVELCGVRPGSDPRDTWLDTVKARLAEDLARFRADIEGDHAKILEWSFLDGQVFASIGSEEDEANPDSGHGWLCRLVDASAAGAAGFERIRRR
jgi:hypothetical protein